VSSTALRVQRWALRPWPSGDHREGGVAAAWLDLIDVALQLDRRIDRDRLSSMRRSTSSSRRRSLSTCPM
jgi:hypothetical protein